LQHAGWWTHRSDAAGQGIISCILIHNAQRTLSKR
jgi:hypothetical protein